MENFKTFSGFNPEQPEGSQSEVAQPELPELALSEKLTNGAEKEIEAIKRMVDEFFLRKYDVSQVDELRKDTNILLEKILDARDIVRSELGGDHPEMTNLIDLYMKVSEHTERLFANHMEEELNSIPFTVEEGDLGAVTEQANYQGNMTLVFGERIQNTEIREQMVRLAFLDKKYEITEKEAPDSTQVSESMILQVNNVLQDTPVTFDGSMPSASMREGARENMDIMFRNPANDEEYTDLQKSYTEAHEKGHAIRKIQSKASATYFAKAMDFSTIHISSEEYEQLKERSKKSLGDDYEERTKEDVGVQIAEYLAEPYEILERMSQMKNYFGFSGDEVFTRQHLSFVKENYVPDTGLDNNMVHFFQCITPATEEHFLRIINTCGV